MTVYFVAGGHLVKIGFTEAETPDDRVASLRTGSPVALKVLAFVPGDRATEYELHKRFESIRHHGEWFTVSKQLAHLIAYARRFRKLDGFEEWAADPKKLALRAAKETSWAAIDRADQALAQLVTLRPEEQWAHTVRLWAAAEQRTVFRASESDCVQVRPGAAVLTTLRSVGVGWLIRGSGAPVSSNKGVHQTAAAIAEMVRRGASPEHFIALWIMAALRDCELAKTVVPGQGLLATAATWFLQTERNPIWHWATKAYLPESFEANRVFGSVEEFVWAAHRLRAQTLLCTEIVDCREELDGVLWYANSGAPLRPLRDVPAHLKEVA